MTDGATVRSVRAGRVVTVEVDRPPLNVLDMATIGALHSEIAGEGGRPDTDVIVLRTKGSRVFSAGVEVAEHTPEMVPEMLKTFHGLILLLLEVGPVTICEVQAPALGGGAELALACDLVVAAEESRFAFPEIDLACFPPVAMATLPFRVGPQRAAEMVLTGGAVSASEARAMGLVNRVVARADLGAETARLVEELTGKSSEVLRMTARLLRDTYAETFRQKILDVEKAYLAELVETRDMKEGIQAFLEKRKPVWERPA